MVRTLDSGGRASGGKAPRKVVTPSASSSSSKGSGSRASTSSGGGNPVCPRETPIWQKPITNFFTKGDTTSKKSQNDVDHLKENDENMEIKGKESTPVRVQEEGEKENQSSNSNQKPKRKKLIIEDDDDDD